MHGQLGGIKNVPRILSALRAGNASLANWQGLVKVRVNLGPRLLHITNGPPELGKFTFHTAMLRDKLGELCMARNVEIVKKVPELRLLFSVHKLILHADRFAADHRFGYRGLQRSR